jgi:hypothetical protein
VVPRRYSAARSCTGRPRVGPSAAELSRGFLRFAAGTVVAAVALRLVAMLCLTCGKVWEWQVKGAAGYMYIQVAAWGLRTMGQ